MSSYDENVSPTYSLLNADTTAAVLQHEVESLRDQLRRALLELKEYQNRYPSPYASGTRSAVTDQLPKWITTSEVMTPLLQAYDDRIKELEHIATYQALQLDNVKDNMQRVIAENEALIARQMHFLENSPANADLSIRSASKYESPYDGDEDADEDSDGEQKLKHQLIDEISKRLESLTAENTILVEQRTLLHDELQLYQNELELRTQELQEVSNKLSEFESYVPPLKQSKQQAEKDRDIAASKAIHFSDLLGKTQAELETHQNELKDLKFKNNELENSLRQEIQAFNQYKMDVEKQGSECVLLAQKADERANQLKFQLNQKSIELETNQEILRKLRLEYTGTRQDAEGMVTVMGGLERQIAELTSKEEDLQITVKEWRVKVEDALCLKDQAVTREEGMRAEVERLLVEREQILMTRSADFDKATREAAQNAVAKMRVMEADMTKLAESTGQRLAEHERAINEHKSLKSQLERMQSARESERRVSEDTVKETEERLNSAVRAQIQEEARCREALSSNIQYRVTIDNLRSQLETLRLQFSQKERVKDVELSTVKSSMRELQREVAEKTRLLHKAEKDATDMKNRFRSELLFLERRLGDENKELRQRAAQAEMLARELEQSIDINATRREQLTDQIRTSTNSTVDRLEATLSSERTKLKNLLLEKSKLDERLAHLTEENQDLSKVVVVADKAIAELEQELQNTRRIVADLAQQLSASYAKRQISVLDYSNRIDLLGLNQQGIDTSASVQRSTDRDRASKGPILVSSDNATVTYVTNATENINPAANTEDSDDVLIATSQQYNSFGAKLPLINQSLNCNDYDDVSDSIASERLVNTTWSGNYDATNDSAYYDVDNH